MRCFVTMPFALDYDDVCQTMKAAIVASAPTEAIVCRRLDEIKAAGRITDDLVREIAESTICIADVTGLNAHVMWEVGYCMALQKPLLLVTQEVGTLPFDLKDIRTIRYSSSSN